MSLDDTDRVASLLDLGRDEMRTTYPAERNLIDEARRMEASRATVFVNDGQPLETAFGDGHLPPQVRIMATRLPGRVEVTVPALMAAGAMADNPPRSVMWAYTITRLYDDLARAVTVEDILDAFPSGVPSGPAYGRLWDAQITDNGNLLDMPKVWRSRVSKAS